MVRTIDYTFGHSFTKQKETAQHMQNIVPLVICRSKQLNLELSTPSLEPAIGNILSNRVLLK